MGRPRKRRREDEGDICAAMEALQGAGNSSTRREEDRHESQYPDDFSSHNSLGMDDLPSPNVRFDVDGYQDDNLDLQIQHSDPLSEYRAWDASQHVYGGSNYTATDPTQLQTPLSRIGHDNTGEGPTPCACLSNLYSTLASFQSPPQPSFPYSMGLLRNAVRLGHTVVRCQICPRSYNTGVQNVMLLGTLVQMISNEYFKLIKHIGQRSANEDKITFRVGEHSLPWDSRHTGTPDCPMGINIDLSGAEWQMLARKAVRQEVLGSSNGTNSLMALIDAMRERQQSLHEGYCPERHIAGHEHNVTKDAHDDGGLANDVCLTVTFIDQLKKLIEALQL